DADRCHFNPPDLWFVRARARSFLDGAHGETRDEVFSDDETERHHRHRRDDACGHDRTPLNVLRLDEFAGGDGQGLRTARADNRGKQVVVPGEQDAEHYEGADAGGDERQDRAEGLEARRAIDHLRLLDGEGYVVEETFQDPDRKGQVERRI